jgi:uncharacterized GH25 family protein
VAVRDTDGNAVANATVGRIDEGKFQGETVATGADGRCRLPLPEGEWFQIAVRHPDFVPEQTWVRAGPEEREVVLSRGARLTVVVLDPTKRPVAGAKVTAAFERRRGAAGVWQWTERTDLGESVTDAEGRAVVGAVPPVSVTVRVDREPFSLHESAVEVGEAPVEHLVVLDAGAVLEGRVLGPGGEGVPGAMVKAQGLARPVATSGPSGAFRLEGVAQGSVRLVADAPGFGPGFFGAALGWGEPVPIAVRSGDVLGGLEIVLSKATYVLGRIVDDVGKPVEGVGVHAYVQHAFALGREARSAADGRFRLGPFGVGEPGKAWIWFQPVRHTIEQVEGEVAPGRDLDLGEIKATPRATVRGRLVGADGHPVQGHVTVTPGHTTAEAAPDGAFELVGIGPGTVTLDAARWDPPVLRAIPVPLSTTAGQIFEGLEIVLLPTKPIRGRVITPDGKPRPGAVVGLMPPGATETTDHAWSDDQGSFAFEHLAEGEYELGLVGSGWIRSDGERFLPEAPAVTASAGKEDVEFVYPLKGGIITGKVVAKRDGRPLAQFDATFLRYTLFIPSDTDLEGFEDPEGAFRYETDQPGTWQVEVEATGYASHRNERFSLAAGEVKDVGTIRLGPGGTIAGRVVDAQQQPVPYARINILNEKLQTNDDEPFTDLEGRFEVPGVSPGPFTVFAVSPRHPLGMVRGVNVREGERTEVDIVFVEPAPLTVDVRDPNGRPVEGAALDFTFPAVAPLTSKVFRNKIPPGYGSHKSDTGGTIFQPCLPPGEVTITIEAQGFEPQTRKLDLKPGEPNRIEIRLRRAGG